MSSIVLNVDRWIKASIATALKAGLTGTYLHVDGAIFPKEAPPSWVELYLAISEANPSSLYHVFYVEMMVGCQVISGTVDAFALQDIESKVKAVMRQTIQVSRYGPPSDPANDQSVVGCLVLREGEVARPIDGMAFGIVKSRDVEVRRSTVEGYLKMELK